MMMIQTTEHKEVITYFGRFESYFRIYISCKQMSYHSDRLTAYYSL